MRNRFKYLCLSILCAVLVTGCAPASGNSTDTLTSGKPTAAATTSAKATALSKTTSAATQATDPTAVAPSGSSVWQADGVINAGEYAHKTTFGPLTVYWSNDDKYLYLAIEARSKGWLAIGLDYDRDMAGANYLIGTIINGKAVAEDSFGNSQGRTFTAPIPTWAAPTISSPPAGLIQGALRGSKFRFRSIREINTINHLSAARRCRLSWALAPAAT